MSFTNIAFLQFSILLCLKKIFIYLFIYLSINFSLFWVLHFLVLVNVSFASLVLLRLMGYISFLSCTFFFPLFGRGGAFFCFVGLFLFVFFGGGCYCFFRVNRNLKCIQVALRNGIYVLHVQYFHMLYRPCL